MSAKWEKVRYLSRVRPDSDDGRTDECNDSLDDSDVHFKINGEYSAQTTEEGFKWNVSREKPSFYRSQPVLKETSYDCVRLSVPQDIGRHIREDAAGRTPLSRTSSVYSLANGHEIDGDIPTRSQSVFKNHRRVILTDLFTKHETGKPFELKVSRSVYRINNLKNVLTNHCVF